MWNGCAFLNLWRAECRQQRQDGDDNIVGVFTFKVRHQGNTVHKLSLCLSTKHRWRKHRVRLFLSHSSPAPRAQSAHRVQQLDPGCCGGDRSPYRCKHGLWFPVLPAVPHLSISFSCEQTSARSSLNPIWISPTPILYLSSLLRGIVRLVRLKDAVCRARLKFCLFSHADDYISVIVRTCHSS